MALMADDLLNEPINPARCEMNATLDEKPSAKSLLREIIEAQPEDASYDEIMRELAFERMVERGMADVRAGRFLSHAEAMEKIRSWRS
jgi:predicted transcriptional regulator